VTCPSTEELAAIYDGNLKGKQAVKVRDHVASCPRCAHELHVLHQSMQPAAEAPSPPGDLVARALQPSKKSGFAPQVNLLRPQRRPIK
jgi:anti-sigma factor RsiW